MSEMFKGAAMFNQDLRSWNAGKGPPGNSLYKFDQAAFEKARAEKADAEEMEKAGDESDSEEKPIEDLKRTAEEMMQEDDAKQAQKSLSSGTASYTTLQTRSV